MEDIFNLTAEDMEDDFVTLKAGEEYKMTVSAFDSKTIGDKPKTIIKCIINGGKDNGKEYSIFYGNDKMGRKIFFKQIAKTFFTEEQLLSGKITKDMYLGKKFMCTAYENKGGYINLKNFAPINNVPTIDGIEEAVTQAVAEDDGSDIF